MSFGCVPQTNEQAHWISINLIKELCLKEGDLIVVYPNMTAVNAVEAAKATSVGTITAISQLMTLQRRFTIQLLILAVCRKPMSMLIGGL